MYEYIELVVDSGACDHVGSEGILDFIPTVPTAASKAGHAWRAANGSTIPNMGEKVITAETGSGHTVYFNMQIGKGINKPP